MLTLLSPGFARIKTTTTTKTTAVRARRGKISRLLCLYQLQLGGQSSPSFLAPVWDDN